jgi:transposase
MKTLLADPLVLKLEKIALCSNAIIAHVKTRSCTAECPLCRQASTKVHSRYTRCIADLPWEGIHVRIHLRTRKFFCHNESCEQRVFCERLPSVVAPYSRQTARLNEALTLIGLALGGRTGARTTDSLGLSASAETLLRRVRRKAQDFTVGTVRVLGVDDWAQRRGRTYGTLLVDIERSRPIGLLPDREAATLARWLKPRADIEVITRDRATYYADGITAGAPAAVQVADRWHLLKNLREVVERVINGHRRKLREAAQTLSPYRTASEVVKAHSLPELRPKQWSPRSTKELARQQAKRARRVERYEEIKAMRATGASISAIARRMGMQRETVRHFLRADEYPEARPPRKPSRVEPFAEYLKERWLAGRYNAMQLYREIKARGYRGHVKVLQAYLEAWRKLLPEEIRRMHGVPDVATCTAQGCVVAAQR